jgi:hypothetical protein
LIQRIYHATGPVEFVAGCLDAVEKPICSAMVEGSMSTYEKAGFADLMLRA